MDPGYWIKVVSRRTKKCLKMPAVTTVFMRNIEKGSLVGKNYECALLETFSVVDSHIGYGI